MKAQCKHCGVDLKSYNTSQTSLDKGLCQECEAREVNNRG